MAFTFTTADCQTAASNLTSSASNFGTLIETMGELINSVSNNYQSDASQTIAESFRKVKEVGPQFQEAVNNCAKYLVETVAPAYEKLEATAKSKIEG